MKKPLVLITGGAGFIGSHTADALAQKGYRIRILDSLMPPVHQGRWPNYLRGKGYELIRGDVRDRQTLTKALQGASYVYHLAAYQDQRPDFSNFFTTNTVSSALIYELILEHRIPIKKVVLASSQFVYGDGFYRCHHSSKTFFPELRPLSQFKKGSWDIFCPHGKKAVFIPFREDQPVHPTNAYGLSKHAIEELALRFGKTYSIPTSLVRYSIVQGARQSPFNLYSGALRIFVSQALAGVPITVYEDGKETRDFVNVHDVVAANVLMISNKKTDFQIFNVGGGRAHTVLGFARLVKRITNSASPIQVGSFRRTDTRHAVSNISKLKAVGWRPRRSVEESVAEYVAWFRKEKFLKVIDSRQLKKLAAGITK